MPIVSQEQLLDTIIPAIIKLVEITMAKYSK